VVVAVLRQVEVGGWYFDEDPYLSFARDQQTIDLLMDAVDGQAKPRSPTLKLLARPPHETVGYLPFPQPALRSSSGLDRRFRRSHQQFPVIGSAVALTVTVSALQSR
jgi:hypothetical protein